MKKIEIIAGYLKYRKGQRGAFELFNIQINEEYRRKGFGSHLINLLEKEIGKDKSIYLFTRKENIIAQRFYEKNGFIKVVEIKDYYTDNPLKQSGDCFIYIKRI